MSSKNLIICIGVLKRGPGAPFFPQLSDGVPQALGVLSLEEASSKYAKSKKRNWVPGLNSLGFWWYLIVLLEITVYRR